MSRIVFELALFALDPAVSMTGDASLVYLLFFFLWLYSPIQALAASMKLSVSLQLLDLGQSVALLGRVISSSQGLLPVHKHRKTKTQHKP
jgi:hypothetical protein